MKRMVSVDASGGAEIVETLQWGVPERTTDTWEEAARAILQGRTYGGCVVVSRDDRGRAALLRALLAAQVAGQPSLTVSGSRYSQGIDYGALMFLVASLPDPSATDPGAILDGFRTQLRNSDGSAPTILVVERPGMLDRHSSMALAQLALRRDVVLVVTCHGTAELGDDLGAIWRAGELAQIELAPLTFDRGVAEIERHLDGRISRYAGTRLWRSCDGSSQDLAGMVEECLRLGKLSLFQDVWVLDEGPLPALPLTAGSAGQPALSPEAGDLLSSLVVTRNLSVNEVMNSDRMDALDELFQAGLARYGTRTGSIQCTDGALRHLGPQGGPLDGSSPDDPLGNQREAIAKAWAALDQHQIDEALEILPGVAEILQVVGSDRDTEFALAALETVVEAYLLQGKQSEAMDALNRALEAIRDSEHAPAMNPQMDRIRLGLARAGLRCGSPDSAAHLAHDAQSALAWIHGTAGVDEGTRLSMAAALAEAWTLGTRQEQAQQLNAWIIRQLVAARNAGTLGGSVRRRDLPYIGSSVLTVAMLGGDWEACRDWLAISDRLAGIAPEMTMMTAVIESAIAFDAGDPEYAIDLMMPALRQLQYSGRHGLAEVASGIVACSLAELGRNAEAQALLAEGDVTVDGTAGMWTVEFHSALCIARLHSTAAGANRMLALADTSRRQGTRLLEAHALGMAVAMGQTALADRLFACAAELEGSLGQSFRELAAGVRRSATGATASALESLVRQGFRSFGDAAFVEIIAGFPVREKRLIHRAVGVLNGRLLDAIPRARERNELVAVNLEGPCGETLTAREREVAELVIHGLSNVQISHRAGVSVRTVEGHLYQVYSKLHVKGRRELVRLTTGDPVGAGVR